LPHKEVVQTHFDIVPAWPVDRSFAVPYGTSKNLKKDFDQISEFSVSLAMMKIKAISNRL